MGMYEFKCRKCNQVFEELVPFEDIPKVRCQACNSKKVDKLLTSALGLGLNTAFDFQAKKNYERATQESAMARQIAGRPAYKTIDDTNRGNRMNFVD